MTTYVDGSSMYPTLSHLDYAISDKIFYKAGGLDRFDIVTFSYKKSTLVKRVIALGGEHITYSDGVLKINDKEINKKRAAEAARGDDKYISILVIFANFR